MLSSCCKQLIRRFGPSHINPLTAVKKHNCAGVSIRTLTTSSDDSSSTTRKWTPSSDRVPPGVSVVKPTAVDDDGSDADDFEADTKPDDDKVAVPEPSVSLEGYTGDEDNEEQRAYYARKVTGEMLPRDPKAYVPYVPLREKQIDDLGRAYGTGKRKTSIARVWIKDGSGVFIVNDKRFVEYFDSMQRESCLESFIASKTAGLFDVRCTVKGGGVSGQAGAIRLGIARALEAYNPMYRQLLAPAGMMTRDDRRVERKKPGQKKARKNFQWVKR